jgi:hypothetical protein
LLQSLVFCSNELGDGLELDVAGTLVDCADLAVTEILLDWEVLGESHPTKHFNALGGHLLCNLRSIKLERKKKKEEGEILIRINKKIKIKIKMIG